MRIKYINYQIKLSLITLSSILTACVGSSAQEKEHRKYLLIHDANMDTINKVLLNNTLVDKHFRLTYITDKGKSKLDTSKYEFPTTYGEIESPKGYLYLIDVKSVNFSNRQYKIYKYLMDNPNMEDEEELYFYTPEIGILIIESGSWSGSERLIKTNNIKKTQLAFYLNEKIISDNHFFNSWKK